MKKRAFSVFLSLTIVFCAISAYLTQAAAEQFLGSGAWHVDDEGALVQEDGYLSIPLSRGILKMALQPSALTQSLPRMF